MLVAIVNIRCFVSCDPAGITRVAFYVEDTDTRRYSRSVNALAGFQRPHRVCMVSLHLLARSLHHFTMRVAMHHHHPCTSVMRMLRLAVLLYANSFPQDCCVLQPSHNVGQRWAFDGVLRAETNAGTWSIDDSSRHQVPCTSWPHQLVCAS